MCTNPITPFTPATNQQVDYGNNLASNNGSTRKTKQQYEASNKNNGGLGNNDLVDLSNQRLKNLPVKEAPKQNLGTDNTTPVVPVDNKAVNENAKLAERNRSRRQSLLGSGGL